MKRVLLVVDFQNDFVTGALGTKEAQAAEAMVCDKIRRFDGEIFYTLDTHSGDYLQTQEGQRLPVPHCLYETEGWSPTPAVRQALMERHAADDLHRLIKHSFGDTHLPSQIRDVLGYVPDEITLIGLCTDICVISNAMILKAAFPETRIVVDAACCAGVTPAAHTTALDAMRPCQIDIENA